MKEQGTVINLKSTFAEVRIGRNSACASCGKCGMTENQKHVDFLVENTLSANVGDVVQIEIPERNAAPLAVVAYILPIVPALVAMFVSALLQWPVWATFLMFVGGFALGFGCVVAIDHIRHHKWMQSPGMVAILSHAPVRQPDVPADGAPAKDAPAADTPTQPINQEEQNNE